jgi:alpha-ketoglutarate-dependent taurine dioxygenase
VFLPNPRMGLRGHRRLRALGCHLSDDHQNGAFNALSSSVAVLHEAGRCSVTPLVRHADGFEFGARIEGINLAGLDAAQWSMIEDAWYRFALLVFPAQHDLRPSDEVAFYRRFRYHDRSAPRSVRRAPIVEAPDIGLIGSATLFDHHGVHGEIRPGGAGVQWHIDGYYDGDLPPSATQLYCVESPASGTGGVLQLAGPKSEAVPYERGATIFADTRLAYRMLSPELRAIAESHKVQYWPGGLHGAWHAGTDNPPMDDFGLVPTAPPTLFDYFKKDTTADLPVARESTSTADLGAGAFHDAEQADLSTLRVARHPVVWRHPHTGIPAVQVHTLAMERLVPAGVTTRANRSLDWEQSQELVRKMLVPCVSSSVYVHNYSPGDLVGAALPCTIFAFSTHNYHLTLVLALE